MYIDCIYPSLYPVSLNFLIHLLPTFLPTPFSLSSLGLISTANTGTGMVPSTAVWSAY